MAAVSDEHARAGDRVREVYQRRAYQLANRARRALHAHERIVREQRADGVLVWPQKRRYEHVRSRIMRELAKLSVEGAVAWRAARGQRGLAQKRGERLELGVLVRGL